ncbi:MAG: cytochrome P450 [Myxococcales bacterium]|nr:cytochrome P450 [Myxococcales bacterium]
MNELPPGPDLHPLRQGMRFGASPFGFLDECARRHGDSFTLRLPGDPPRIVCSHPEDVRRIFALEPDHYVSHDVSIPLNLGARGLLFLDGESHLADRRLMVPPLHGDHLEGYARLIQQVTARRIASFRPGDSFAMHPEMQWVTLSVIMTCVFGLAEGHRLERLRHLTTRWLDGTLTPLVFLVSMAVTATRVRRFLDRAAAASQARYPEGPAPWRLLPWQRLADAKAEIIAILEQEIAECRVRPPGDRRDVMALLVSARYEDGRALETGALIDELIMLLVGGHETTANALCWALRHILARPDVLDRLRAELDEAFPGGKVDATKARKLPYLDACIKESMRLTPIAPAVGRSLIKPLPLERGEAPAGTIVWPCIYLTHRRPDLWPAPEEFRPERFLGEAKVSPNHFFPFGGGRRRCIGMAFASLEMQVVLAELLMTCDLALATGSRPTPIMRGITISPADGLRVVFAGPRRPTKSTTLAPNRR